MFKYKSYHSREKDKEVFIRCLPLNHMDYTSMPGCSSVALAVGSFTLCGTESLRVRLLPFDLVASAQKPYAFIRDH